MDPIDPFHGPLVKNLIQWSFVINILLSVVDNSNFLILIPLWTACERPRIVWKVGSAFFFRKTILLCFAVPIPRVQAAAATKRALLRPGIVAEFNPDLLHQLLKKMRCSVSCGKGHVLFMPSRAFKRTKFLRFISFELCVVLQMN